MNKCEELAMELRRHHCAESTLRWDTPLLEKIYNELLEQAKMEPLGFVSEINGRGVFVEYHRTRSADHHWRLVYSKPVCNGFCGEYECKETPRDRCRRAQ